MRYAIVDTDKASAKSMVPAYHKLNNVGTKMVVNENELLKVNPDPEVAARELGGSLTDLPNVKLAMTRWDE